VAKPPAKALMIQGTSSSVGKSVIAAALCRILAQNGVNVAPFKAQNMSNNSYVTADGGEMGRAQVVQAQAAGVEPHTDMNPVLLKPEADSRSQVVINGEPVGSFEARKYWGDQTEVWAAVTEAYDRLAAQYDVIVLEGAGSPAEVNLRDRDIVNMRMAAYANASVILVGDIDRGGVFASLLGTMELLLPEERSLVKATLINRFRGDLALLDPLPELIAERTGVPVLGVVPFVYDLQVKDEDGVTFGDYDPPSMPTTDFPSEAEGSGEGSRSGSPSQAGRELEGGSNRPTTNRPSTPETTPQTHHPEPRRRVTEAEGSGEGSRMPDSFSQRENARLRENRSTTTTPDQPQPRHPELDSGSLGSTKYLPVDQPINIAVIALPRVSNHDDLDPFRRAGCRIRIVTNPHELATAHIVIIPGSKSTIADLRWMKSRGLDQAVIEAAHRNVTVVGICGGYQILGQQLDDPEATESPEPQSEPGLGLLPTSTVFDTVKTTRRVNIEIPTHTDGPLKGESATGTGYEIHTGITTGADSTLSTLSDDTPNSFSKREKARLRENRSTTTTPNATTNSWPDGTQSETLPVIGSYVHGLFDSPEILRRLLNTTAETHNLPTPVITEFSMEAEYDRLAHAVRTSIDMNLINALLD